MTASTMKDSVFSGFSLSLLKDTGWYGVNEKKFEDLFVGKDMGCDWFKGCKSDKNKEYFCKDLKK